MLVVSQAADWDATRFQQAMRQLLGASLGIALDPTPWGMQPSNTKASNPTPQKRRGLVQDDLDHP